MAEHGSSLAAKAEGRCHILMEQGFATQLPLKTQLGKTLSQRQNHPWGYPNLPVQNQLLLHPWQISAWMAPTPQNSDPLFKKKIKKQQQQKKD